MIRTFKKPAIPTQKLPVDDIEVRESGLLIPGKKPTGPVSIVMPGLRSAILFRNNSFSVSPHNNNGTISAGNTYQVVQGITCIDCRGPSNNDVITLPTIQSMRGGSLGSYTIHTRARADSVSTRAGIFNQGSDSGTDGHYIFYEGSSTVRATIDDWNLNYASASITSSNWNWITSVYNSATNGVSIYVNGVAGSSGTATASTNTTNPLLGAVFYPAFNRQLDGQISDFFFFDYAMTAEQVKRFVDDPYCLVEPA